MSGGFGNNQMQMQGGPGGPSNQGQMMGMGNQGSMRGNMGGNERMMEQRAAMERGRTNERGREDFFDAKRARRF